MLVLNEEMVEEICQFGIILNYAKNTTDIFLELIYPQTVLKHNQHRKSENPKSKTQLRAGFICSWFYMLPNELLELSNLTLYTRGFGNGHLVVALHKGKRLACYAEGNLIGDVSC